MPLLKQPSKRRHLLKKLLNNKKRQMTYLKPRKMKRRE